MAEPVGLPPRIIDAGSLRSPDAVRICAVCLTVAQALHELGDCVTIIGGLVPSLLIDQDSAMSGFNPHAGTRDLDLGLDIGIAEPARLGAIGDRLRQGGFVPRTVSADDTPASCWSHIESTHVRIDLVVQATTAAPHLQTVSIGPGLTATALGGLEFAFRDRIALSLTGSTLRGEPVTSRLHCCGPASFVILKTNAFLNRGADKDIYDLVYLLRYWPDGIQAIAAELQHWRKEKMVAATISSLRTLFVDLDSDGPHSYIRFRQGHAQYEIGTDATYSYAVEAHSTVLKLLRYF